MDDVSIKLSVAIVTRNRPDSLERTLRSLREQSVQPWEVLVSDDSDASHAAEVERIAHLYGTRYLRGPQRGLYANRNFAALACRGTHIRTMDDDHEFPPDHMAACLKAVQEDPESIWIIGEFSPDTPDTGQKVHCPGQLHPRGYSVLPADPQRCWAIADGASIYPKTIFEQGLRFLEDYKFGAAYLEFGSRLYWLDYRIRQLTETHIYHHYDPTNRSFMNLEIDLASRFCAMLCHSYLYQPSLKNKVLCGLEVVKQLALHGAITVRCFASARRVYQRQHQSLKSGRGGQPALVSLS